MIYSVKGTLVHTDLTCAVIDTGNIAFRCFTTLNTLSKLDSVGSEVCLLTYLNVKEDALDLYGFYESEELDCFKLLLSVSGVGPKAALSILSQLKPDQLAIAISTQNTKAISAANGIGKKTAERVILELKDKLSAVVSNPAEECDSVQSTVTAVTGYNDAIGALVSLGYSQSDANKALAGADQSLDAEQLIKYALKNLM